MKQKRAFTLIELLLVLVMLGIIVGVGITNYGGTYKAVAVRQTTNDMAFMMRYAQSQAVIRRQVYKFSLSDGSHSYRLSRARLDQKDDTGNFELIPERMGRNVKIPIGISVAAEHEDMLFYPDGTIDKNRLTISSGKRSMIVSSQEQRGYIFVFDQELKP